MSHVEFELAPQFANTPLGIEAEELLDKCIDCGQCMVKCPTFRLLNEDEESPRGRIQLMRKMYATGVVDHELQQRLDHCLTCRSCEAMCPEHVPFGHLLDITKSHIEKELPRSWRTQLLRLGMRMVRSLANADAAQIIAAFDRARHGESFAPDRSGWSASGLVNGYWFGEPGIVQHQHHAIEHAGA